MVFEKMVDILPEGAKGEFSVSHIELSEKTVEFEKMVANVHGRMMEVYGLKAGKYVKLTRGKSGFGQEIVMSDTWMEQHTNEEIVSKANGRVLIAGLGIGLILLPIQSKLDVTSITVVEANQEVIDLVKPHLSLNSKVEIVRGDIFEWLPQKGEKYDTIYFDIWSNICGDYWPQVKNLHARFRKYLDKSNPRRFMASWRQQDFREAYYRG